MSNPSEGMKSKMYRYHLEWVISSKKTKVSRVPYTAYKSFSEVLRACALPISKKSWRKYCISLPQLKKQTLLQTRIQSRNASGVGFNFSIATYLVVNECNEVFALNGYITIGVRVDLFIRNLFSKGRPKLLLIAKIAGENNRTEMARFLSSASET